ncbi:metallophosphoesterase [Candidatus Pacearchaeota archaeon]|nr:metallophosphoesterase [Candidatus Pacearchaeota archaeon]
MKQEMLDFCRQRGILIDRSILELLGDLQDLEIAKNLIERIEYQYKQKIITKAFFYNNLNKVSEILMNYSGEDKRAIEDFLEKLGLDLKILVFDEKLPQNNKKEEFFLNRNNHGINLLKIYQNQPKKIEVNDFVKNFRNRFNTLKNFLQERTELENLASISRIENNKIFSLIAIVYDKKVTKNDNILLELEDLTGKVTAIVNKNRLDVYEKSKEIILDEVIGLKCSGSRDMVFVNDIVFPDIKLLEKKKSNKEELVAFTSDVHVGSDKFLEKNFLKFISWLNGKEGSEKQKEEALKVKYLFITGDSVDGVGVYPGQETQLDIIDVRDQYKKLAELLLMIRNDVKIILCPGQHDAVRVAEPQPIIGETYGGALYNLDNLYLVTNPSLIEVGTDVKFKVLMYHGASMHGIINSIDNLRMNRAHDYPTQIVKYMLKKRHLAPTHSLVTYTPLENEDALLIKEIPDIVATGDLHRPEISDYNGILLFSGSCWQSITPFEEKVGNNPDPCKVPILNLQTREVKMLDFSDVNELDNKENELGGEI